MDSPSPRRRHHHSLNSPNSSTSSSTNSSNGGLINQHLLLPPPPLTPTSSVAAQAPPPPPPPPLFPPRNTFGRSEAGNLYPTTFVQADTNTFKQVVQMLTGCNETARLAATNAIAATNTIAHSSKAHIPPMKTILNKNHQQHHNQSGFKLYERRSNNLNLNSVLPTLSPSNNNVVAGGGNVGSPRFSSPRNNHLLHHHHQQEVLSPSILDLPALVLSPVTPLIPDPFGRSSAAGAGAGYYGNGNVGNGNGGAPVLNIEAEERAIKEKGFYFHPSPANTPRDTEPRLLPLFPTASPRASVAASAAAAGGSSSSA